MKLLRDFLEWNFLESEKCWADILGEEESADHADYGGILSRSLSRQFSSNERLEGYPDNRRPD